MGKQYIKHLLVIPPGGFNFTVKETGMKFHSMSPRTCMDKVISHLEANNLETPIDPVEWFEDEWCKQNPDIAKLGFCRDEDDRPSKIRRSKPGPLSPSAMKRYWRMFRRWKKRGGQYVSMKQAEERAAVCVGCKMNKVCAGCPSALAGIARFSLGIIENNRTTKYDDKLKSCKACGCDLRAKVHIPHEDQFEEKGGVDFPSHCWMVTERNKS